jgi:hypothetical protein
LYVPGQCLEVKHGHVARGILVEVIVVGHLAGGLGRRRRRRGGGGGGAGEGGEGGSCVLCGVMWLSLSSWVRTHL